MLRLVSITAVTLAVLNSAGLAEENEPVEFAPGSQGVIKPPVMGILNEADRQADELENRLRIQEPHDYGVVPDVESIRDRALNNARVQRLLGIDGVGSEAEGLEARTGERRALLALSFSMPPQALRAAFADANRFGIPLVFKGFVNNSVFDTQAALKAVFGDEAETLGFGLDLTVFTRFRIDTVPQLIVLPKPLDVCHSEGCSEDPYPLHDKVSGNVGLEFALSLVAHGKGEAGTVAAQILERAGL